MSATLTRRVRLCDRCRGPLDPLRATLLLNVTEGVREGRRLRLLCCEGCAVAFAVWLDSPPRPRRSAPAEVLDDDQADELEGD